MYADEYDRTTLEYAEVLAWEWNAKLVKLEAVQMMTADEQLDALRTNSTVSRAELGMSPLGANRYTRKWKRQCSIRNMPKRLPAIVERVLWKRVTKGQAGKTWDVK